MITYVGPRLTNVGGYIPDVRSKFVVVSIPAENVDFSENMREDLQIP